MRRFLPALIVVIGLLAIAIDFLPNLKVPFGAPPGQSSRALETKLGLDLQGGLRVEYQAQCVADKCPTTADMSVVRDIIERRVNSTGVSEPQVVTQGTDRVVVELPGATDVESVRALVGQTGRLEFVPIPPGVQVTQNQQIDVGPGSQFTPLFGGDQVDTATLGSDPQTGQRAVDFRLKGDAASKFATYTSQNIGQQFAIVLDGTIISAPTIQSAIPGGQGQITGGPGGFSSQEANNLITVLRYGSLPFPVKELSNEQISATLGDAFLKQSVVASIIGIALVLLFMVLHYRLPGVIASGALVYYALVVLAIFRLVPVTLTLAGIAGFVLSVGMAVDANILIFERTKEELRVGKSLPLAIEAGFNRAWNSILDSNVSSLITAFILYFFGSSVIRGFALVLIIGVLVSMFTAITVTRSVLRVVVARQGARKAWLYGVSDQEFVARPSARTRLRGEARGRV
ncbi:MAG TPA: protein translocase subunit SecD [Candidatus Limnocylindrales bacterium]|nr:protein translocase subunit SecD [Candidatus Limnocylindrales bacterium]